MTTKEKDQLKEELLEEIYGVIRQSIGVILDAVCDEINCKSRIRPSEHFNRDNRLGCKP